MTTVAFIGLGTMGSRMAGRLLAAGHDVVAWNRTAAKTDALVAAGARRAATPAGAAAEAEAVVTMVADPEALCAVVEGPDGIATGVRPAATMIEMSTVGLAAVARLRASLPSGVGLIDAPVFGTPLDAESGALAILAGGDPEVVEQWTPLLSCLGTVRHMGPHGTGAAAKLVVNTTVVGVLGLLGEALALGTRSGLPLDKCFEALSVTALGGPALRRRAAIEARRYTPALAGLSLTRKDADLILEAAAALGVETRLVPAARAWFVDAEEAGLGPQDCGAVIGYQLRED